LCTRRQGRTDICDSCYEWRFELIKDKKPAITPEQFDEHLKHASEVVSKWPEWKRNILGRVDNMDKIREMLQNLADKDCWSDELNDGCIVDDFAGGNIDDAFSGGQNDGEIRLARTLITMLDEI